MLANGREPSIPDPWERATNAPARTTGNFIARFRVTRLFWRADDFSVLAKLPLMAKDWSSLSPFSYGSTALPISVNANSEQLSCVRILNSYGLTENTRAWPRTRDGQSREGSSGVPSPLHASPREQAEQHWDAPCELRPNQTGMIQSCGPG